MSIVDQALRVLHYEYSSPLDKLKAMPWLTLLIVKWAVQDNLVYISVGKVITPQEFDALRNLLLNIQREFSKSPNTPNIYAMLRTMLHTQIQFQRSANWGFLRWPALIAQLEQDHPTRIQFEDTFLMSPETFMELSFALYTPALNGEMRISPTHFNILDEYYDENMTTFLAHFVRDLPSLRKELQTEEHHRLRGKIEFFEFPYLQRFPILQAPNKDMIFWHPLVFARGMEDAVHLRLSNFGANYTEPFSKVFESYVLGLLKETNIPFFGEDEVKQAFGQKVSTVEAVIECADCNIFIEAKMSLFWDEVLLDDNPEKIFNKTERVRTAIKQGWQASDLLRCERGQLGNCANKAQDFMLVVTSRQLNIGDGNRLNNLYPEMSFEQVLPVEKRKYLPPENIFVLSIEDFEMLVGHIKGGAVDLASLLKQAVKANSDPAAAQMFFSDFLRKHQKQETSRPHLIQQAIDESTASLSNALRQKH